MDGLTGTGPASTPRSTSPDEVDAGPGFDVRSFARGGLFSLVGALTSGVLGFVLAVVVTRKFPEETVGILFTALSVFLLAYTFVRLGASTGAVYFIARVRALGEPERVRSVLRSALPPVVWVSLTTALGLIVLAPWLGRVILSSAPAEAAQALRVLACFLPFAAVMDVCLYGTRGLHRLRPLVLVDQIGRPVAQLILVIGCVVIGTKSASALVFAWASPYLPAAGIAAVWLWVLVRRSGRRSSETTSTPGTMHREFWGYSWARWLQSIAQIGLQRIDIILVAAISGAKEAAIYAAVTRFLVFGQLAAGSVTAVAEPRISKLVALKDTAGVQGLYRVSTTWLVLGTWPLYLGLVVFAAQLPRIFGPSYSSGTPVVVVLGLTMLVATGCGLVDTVLAMAGRTTWTFANAVSALAVNVSVDLVLIPRIGILGAAIGWSVAILVKNLVPLFLVERHLRINPFGKGTVTAAALAVGCLGIVPGTLAVLRAPFALLLVVSIVAFALYALLVWRRRSLFQLDVLRRGPGGQTPVSSAPEHREGEHARQRRRWLPFGRVPLALLLVAVVGVGLILVSVSRRDAPPDLNLVVRPGPVEVQTTGHGPNPPTDQVWVGAWTDPKVFTQAGKIAAVENLEARTGRQLDLVNVYHVWDDDFPAPSDVAVVAAGRQLMVSWAGADMRKIAAGDYDELIRSRAQAVRDFQAPLLIRWRWEMDRPNLRASVWSPEDFIAAWTHVRTIFLQQGATNAGFVWCPLANGFPSGRAQAYYPGDDQVDWLCADVYPDENGSSFAQEAGPFLDWAQAHPRPIVIGEFGAENDPDDVGFQGQWIAGAAAVAKVSGQIRAMVYFEGVLSDNNDKGKAGYDFSLVPGSPGLRAFSRLASDLAHRPLPIAAPTPSSTTGR